MFPEVKTSTIKPPDSGKGNKRMSKVAKKVTDEKAATVVFAFEGNAGTLQAKLAELPKEIQARLALHGLAQKVGDSYAGADTPADAAKFATETYQDLKEGKWSNRAVSSGPKISTLAQAIARIKGIAVDAATAKIKALSEETVKALRKNPDVKAMMATIIAENAAAKAQAAKGGDGASVDSLLSTKPQQPAQQPATK